MWQNSKTKEVKITFHENLSEPENNAKIACIPRYIKMPIRLFDRASWNTRIQHELSKSMQKLNSSLRWNTKLYSILFHVITHPFKGSTWKFDISRSMNENRLSQDTNHTCKSHRRTYWIDCWDFGSFHKGKTLLEMTIPSNTLEWTV